MGGYLDKLKPGTCPICEGAGGYTESGDGWSEWCECNVCDETGTLTAEMIDRERIRVEAAMAVERAYGERAEKIEGLMLKIDPECFAAGDLDRLRKTHAAAVTMHDEFAD